MPLLFRERKRVIKIFYARLKFNKCKSRQLIMRETFNLCRSINVKQINLLIKFKKWIFQLEKENIRSLKHVYIPRLQI